MSPYSLLLKYMSFDSIMEDIGQEGAEAMLEMG
jgi:hypothetical protein